MNPTQIMSTYDFEKLCRTFLRLESKESFLNALIFLECSMHGYEWVDVQGCAKTLGLRDNFALSKKTLDESKRLGFVETRKVDASKGLTKHQLRITEQVDLVPINSHDGMKMQRVHQDLSKLTQSTRTMMTPKVGLILIAIHIRGLRLTKDINEYIGGHFSLWQGRIKNMQKMEVEGLLHMRELARGAKPKLLVTPVDYL